MVSIFSADWRNEILQEIARVDSRIVTYQTGTFTPGLSFGGASTGITYGANTQGAYVRIGNLAYMTGWVMLTSKGTATGGAAITGLPYSRAGNDFATLSIGRALNMTGLTGALGGYSNSNTITLTQSAATGTGSVTDANFTNATQVFFSHTMSI